MNNISIWPEFTKREFVCNDSIKVEGFNSIEIEYSTHIRKDSLTGWWLVPVIRRFSIRNLVDKEEALRHFIKDVYVTQYCYLPTGLLKDTVTGESLDKKDTYQGSELERISNKYIPKPVKRNG